MKSSISILLVILLISFGCKTKTKLNTLNLRCEIVDSKFDSTSRMTIKATITNNSDSLQEFIMPVCEYSDLFLCNSEILTINGQECENDIYEKVILNPNQYIQRNITLRSESKQLDDLFSFKIGFHKVIPKLKQARQLGNIKTDEYYQAMEDYMRTYNDHIPIWSNWIYVSDINH